MDSLFFYLSKIAWAFLSPGNLIVFALVLSMLLVVTDRIRAAQFLLVPTAIISFVLMVYPVSDYVMQPLENRFQKPETLPKSIDGIIVLGGGEDLQRALSWNTPELGLGADRYIGAAKLAAAYPKAPVIFTGGSGSIQLQNTGSEGSFAKQLLTTIGIDPDRLIIESQSRNTYENFLLTRSLLPKEDGRYLLVTSAYHMPRAVGIARKQNLNVMPYPVDYRSSRDGYRQFDFDFFDHLKTLEPAWKEWVGLTVYFATGKTERWFPEPE